MNARRFTKRLAILLAVAGLPIAVFAQAAGSNADSTRAAPSCEEARQFAYFQRQLRMTEGDTEALVPAEPRECGARSRAEGGNDAVRAKADGEAAKPRDERADAALPFLGGA